MTLTVEVVRGPQVESEHAVAAYACDVHGSERFAAGPVDRPFFTRSAAKPFIAAAAVVRSGAAARFGLGPREVAIACGSHAGEAEHRAVVAGFLAKLGATPDDLRCGTPPHTGTPLANNCSGKHAGLLALARMLDAPLAGYLEPEHPVQRVVLAFCRRAFADPLPPDRIGVDGCGIPTFAVSLRAGARALAGLAAGAAADPADAAALAGVRTAMQAEPWFVAGTGRFDTDLIRHGGGLVAKVGAEGIHAAASPALGVGVMLKVLDGSARAAAPAALAVLERLGALDPAALAALAGHRRPAVTNVAGRTVGEIRVAP